MNGTSSVKDFPSDIIIIIMKRVVIINLQDNVSIKRSRNTPRYNYKYVSRCVVMYSVLVIILVL